MSPDGGAGRAAEAAQELYALPPGEFTGERDRLVRAAREAGDRELATAVGELRRPVLAAWAVNLLVRNESELLQQVLDVGEALREAQEGLQGDALRELGRQRRELVAAVVARAAAIVAESGATLSEAAQQQVGTTLNAALGDPEAARVVTSGLLVKPLETGGLPALELREHVAAGALRSRASSSPPRPGSESDTDQSQAELQRLSAERRRLRREAAEQRVTDAQQAAEEARTALADVRRRHEQAQSRVLQVEARIDELRRQLAELEAEAEAAVDRAEELEQESEDAEEAATEAEAELAEAREQLAELE